MPNLTIRSGITRMAKDLAARHVLGYIVEALLRGDETAISISDMSSAIAIPVDEVIGALELLEHFKLISIAKESPWADLSSFTIERLEVHLIPAQLAMDLSPHESVSSRIASGMDSFEIQGDLYQVTVVADVNEDGTRSGWYKLSVTRNPGKLDELEVVTNREFKTQPEAWEWWDQYVQTGFAPQTSSEPPEGSAPSEPEATIPESAPDEVSVAVDQLSEINQNYRSLELLLDSKESFEFHLSLVEICDGPDLCVLYEPKYLKSGNPMDRFTFTPKLETEGADPAKWEKTVSSSRVPVTGEAFLEFTTNIAKKHWKDHYGGNLP